MTGRSRREWIWGRPDARILSHQIDGDRVEIFNEKTRIFRSFTIEELTSFQAEQKTLAERKALDQGPLIREKQAASDSVRLPAGSLPDNLDLTVFRKF